MSAVVCGVVKISRYHRVDCAVSALVSTNVVILLTILFHLEAHEGFLGKEIVTLDAVDPRRNK